MNRSSYMLFIIGLIAQLVLANFYYFGPSAFFGICFLTMNYIIMLLLRDWLIGFEVILSEKNMDEESKMVQPIFLFGTIAPGKDPLLKFEKVLRSKINGKSGFINYILFSGWTSFCFYFIFPKIGLSVSVGLLLSMMASWFLMNAYQMAHFLVPLALSFLILLVAFLKQQGVGWVLYLPFLILFFTNLSMYRSLIQENEGKEDKVPFWSRWSGHLRHGMNLMVILGFTTFILYQLLLIFQGSGRPKLEMVSEQVKKKVTQFAADQIQDYVNRKQKEKGKEEGREISDSGDSQGDRKMAGDPKPGSEEGGEDEPSPQQEIKKIEETIDKMIAMDHRDKKQSLEKLLEEQKQDFRQLNKEFEKAKSQFKDIERRQAMQKIEGTRRRLESLNKKPLDPKDLEKFQKLLSQEFPKVDQKKLSEMLQSQTSKGSGEIQPPSGGYEELPEEKPSLSHYKNEKGDLPIPSLKEPEQAAQGKVASGDGNSQPPIDQQVFKSNEGKISGLQEKEDPGLLKPKPFNEWQVKVDQFLNQILGIVKVLWLLFVIVFGSRWLRNFKKQKPDQEMKQVFGLSDEKKKLVETKLQVLRQQNLSPNQEALLTYRFFLETMALAEYPKEKWCPATEFLGQLNQDFVGMDETATPITEAFCNTHYGHKTLNKEDLHQLRTARDGFAKRMTA